MIFGGILFTVVPGLVAYKFSESGGSRKTLIEWVLFFGLVIACLVGAWLDFMGELRREGNLATIMVLAVIIMTGPAVLAGEFLRIALKWNLSPTRVGLIVFGLSYVLLNIVSIYLRLKEPA